jgi:TatD DNase family protein
VSTRRFGNVIWNFPVIRVTALEPTIKEYVKDFSVTRWTVNPHTARAPTPSANASMSCTPPDLIDIGINLAHDSYDVDREDVIARAIHAGVTQMIVTGSCAPSTRKAIELARSHPQRLFATAGIHPHHATDMTDALLAEIADLASAPEVVAVGECGLDYFRNFAPHAAQQHALHSQLELAARLRKPVFLHQRDAHADFLAILREHWPTLCGGVAHCFTAGAQELQSYLELGLAIGITGWICDERRGAHLLQLVARVPADRLMIETDGPYLLPRDLLPKPPSRRNEPSYLPHIARTIAAARGESLETLAAVTAATTRRLFHLPAPPGHG